MNQANKPHATDWRYSPSPKHQSVSFIDSKIERAKNKSAVKK